MMKRVVCDFPTMQRDCSVWARVGARLKALRAHLGLTIEGIAEKLRVEPDVYERYETGSEQIPARLLADVAGIFGVPVLWFFPDVDAPGEPVPQAGSDQPPVYRVATTDERAQVMADCFRKLDLEGQQHLLAIAAALSEANPAAESNGLHLKARSNGLAPRPAQRRSSLQNSSRKSK